MYKPSEQAMQQAINSRQAAREKMFIEYMATSDLSRVLSSLGLAPMEGASHYEEVCRIVDFVYPQLFEESQPMPIHENMQNSATTVEAVPASPSEYPDITGATVDRNTVDRDKLNHPAFPGGFMPDELVADQRAFVGYRDRDGQSMVKLDVVGVRNISGFDVYPGPKRVVEVSLPDNWLAVDYIQKWVASLMDVAQQGDAERVIDVIANLAAEQGWNHFDLWRRWFGHEGDPAFSDAPTEVRLQRPDSLAEVTQVNPVVSNESMPRDQGDWREGV